MPIRPLSKELQEVAVKELNEVTSRVQADLDHLREWISQQPHLKARTDDQWLLTFLRGSKFSLQRAKQKIDFFYTVRKRTPEVHTNRDPFLPEIQEMLRRGVMLVLPKTAHPTAPRITVVRGERMDPEKISLTTYEKVMLMILDILLLEDDNLVVAGDYFITDLKNLPLSYIKQITPSYWKRLIMYVQDLYPIRMKGAVLLSTPLPIVMVYNMIKMFVSEKIRNRIFFYTENDFEKIFESEFVTTSILPKEYGGDDILWDELAVHWKAKVESYRDWFLEDAQYGTDETKRLDKSTIDDSPFGVEGSFIKLEID